MSVPFRGLSCKRICGIPVLSIGIRHIKERSLKDSDLVCVTWLKIHHGTRKGHCLGLQAKMNFYQCPHCQSPQRFW